jgi:hypothetical protein
MYFIAKLKNKRMRLAVFLVILAAATCCSPKKNAAQNVTDFMDGEKLSEQKSKKLKEVSGLEASIANKGLLWTHNDSGNDPEIFLIDNKSNIRQTYVLDGIGNRDWEDITLGPGPDSSKNYLYVGEIGDNLAAHSYKLIYRFEEPVFKGEDEKVHIADFEVLTFKLADSNKDTEALMIDPNTKDLYVISKWNQPVDVYQIKYPYSAGDTLIAQPVSRLDLTKVTAADISADGSEILVKSYKHVFYWKNNNGLSIPELLKQPPQKLNYEEEPQGEAITWAADGSGFYTLSEMNKGEKTFLYFYKRKQK